MKSALLQLTQVFVVAELALICMNSRRYWYILTFKEVSHLTIHQALPYLRLMFGTDWKISLITPKGPQKDSYDPETGEEIPSYKGGNDTFDYHGWDKGVEPEKQQSGATPDPLDDCDVLTSGGKEATDHSLGIPPDRIPIINKIMNVQLQNFDNYKDRFSTGYQQQIIGNVVRDANILFNTEYNPLKLGIYGVDEK